VKCVDQIEKSQLSFDLIRRFDVVGYRSKLIRQQKTGQKS
jgi:hypothetical protein